MIRILLKRAAGGTQTFKLNTSDFDKTGPGKKSSYKFSIQFQNGRMESVTGMQALGRDLASVLLQDPVAKQLFGQHTYQVGMDSKFTLTITMVPAPGTEQELTAAPLEAEQ